MIQFYTFFFFWNGFSKINYIYAYICILALFGKNHILCIVGEIFFKRKKKLPEEWQFYNVNTRLRSFVVKVIVLICKINILLVYSGEKVIFFLK